MSSTLFRSSHSVVSRRKLEKKSLIRWLQRRRGQSRVKVIISHFLFAVEFSLFCSLAAAPATVSSSSTCLPLVGTTIRYTIQVKCRCHATAAADYYYCGRNKKQNNEICMNININCLGVLYTQDDMLKSEIVSPLPEQTKRSEKGRERKREAKQNK